MRAVPMYWVASLLVLSAVASSASAQQVRVDPETLEVFRTVIAHRITNEDDGTPFDGCFLSAVIGGLEPLVAALGPLGQEAFPNPAAPCPGPTGDRIEFTSLGVGATTSRIVLRIVKGDEAHREEYTLSVPPVFIEGAPRWIVADVRVVP